MDTATPDAVGRRHEFDVSDSDLCRTAMTGGFRFSEVLAGRGGVAGFEAAARHEDPTGVRKG
ncbi:hypothetical protein ACWCQQ_50840, partial [Streptomyces sp. NPDC002143]